MSNDPSTSSTMSWSTSPLERIFKTSFRSTSMVFSRSRRYCSDGVSSSPGLPSFSHYGSRSGSDPVPKQLHRLRRIARADNLAKVGNGGVAGRLQNGRGLQGIRAGIRAAQLECTNQQRQCQALQQAGFLLSRPLRRRSTSRGRGHLRESRRPSPGSPPRADPPSRSPVRTTTELGRRRCPCRDGTAAHACRPPTAGG